jgi:hypothetical protein
MNLRRLTGSPPQTGHRILPHRRMEAVLCTTAKLAADWQVWVIHVIRAIPACPVCPESGATAAARVVGDR